ncbi:MAG TPA: DUF2231 domain-containing protein [Candidatus Binatia bacterium]|nr:DUF2231 domain-containing protein [Candidatus Binatia bacterium]
MSTPARIFDHPIHPMLIPFPIGLWVFSLVADVVFRMTGDPTWPPIAFWTMVGGTIGALMAAVPGLLDFLSIRERRAVRLATIHMVLNLTIVAMFAINIALRMGNYAGGLPMFLSAVAVGLLLVSGWLGWELIYREGVALSPRIDVRVRDSERRGAA